MSDQRAYCAPTQDGCLRCQSTHNASVCSDSAALVMTLEDNNASTTLCQLLDANTVAYEMYDNLVVIAHVRPQLSQIAAVLSAQLLPCTLSSISAAYAPQGADTAAKRTAALFLLKPLPQLLENAAHGWMREVLDNDYLISVFHAIVDIRTGTPYAYEALIRARVPHSQELISAPMIINACEKLNLQHQLDQKARRTAIRCASELDLGDAYIFINFLPNTVYDPKVCLRTTMEAAEQYKIPLSQLVLEVVETEEIKDMARLSHILDYYRERGIGTAVDDMGAGFTSMEYLRALRPDFVKMDRDVVREAEHNALTRHEFEATVRLAKELKCAVIAEGIETPAQAEMCRSIGVDYLQGFLFSKPANPPQPIAYDLSAAPLRAAA